MQMYDIKCLFFTSDKVHNCKFLTKQQVGFFNEDARRKTFFPAQAFYDI